MSSSVTLKNYLEDGKEHIQNFYNAGNGIYESSLDEKEAYSANAVADKDCKIYMLDKKIRLINNISILQPKFYLHSVHDIKFLMAKSIIMKDPDQKITQIIGLL